MTIYIYIIKILLIVESSKGLKFRLLQQTTNDTNLKELSVKEILQTPFFVNKKIKDPDLTNAHGYTLAEQPHQHQHQHQQRNLKKLKAEGDSLNRTILLSPSSTTATIPPPPPPPPAPTLSASSGYDVTTELNYDSYTLNHSDSLTPSVAAASTNRDIRVKFLNHNHNNNNNDNDNLSEQSIVSLRDYFNKRMALSKLDPNDNNGAKDSGNTYKKTVKLMPLIDHIQQSDGKLKPYQGKKQKQQKGQQQAEDNNDKQMASASSHLTLFPVYAYNNQIIHHMDDSTNNKSNNYNKSENEQLEIEQSQQGFELEEKKNVNVFQPKLRLQRSSNYIYNPDFHSDNDDDDDKHNHNRNNNNKNGVDVDDDDNKGNRINDIYTFQNNPQDIIHFKEFRYLHDFFTKYYNPHHVKFGHVEHRPRLFERRFQIVRGGNRFKGEVIWSDDKGSYGEQYWDLAIGML